MSGKAQSDVRTCHLLATSRLFFRTRPELSSYLGSQLSEYNDSLLLTEPLSLSRASDRTNKESSITASTSGPCSVCGSLQIPGRGCSVSIETKRPKYRSGKGVRPPPIKGGKSQVKERARASAVEKAVGKRGKAGRLSSRSILKRTCLGCRRYVVESFEKPEMNVQKAEAKTMGTQRASFGTRAMGNPISMTSVDTQMVVLDQQRSDKQAASRPSPLSSSAAKATSTQETSVRASGKPTNDKKARKKQKKGGLAAILAQVKAKDGSGGGLLEGSFGFADFAKK